MSRRRTAVLLSAVALALTGVPAVPITGSHPDAAVADTGPDARVFVNEIHYTNAGVDAGEFVELAGPAGADLTGYDVVLYDGESGATYASTPLTTSVGTNGVAVVDYPVEGVQDGPDGVALVKGDTVTQFVSWGGPVTAADGPAAGQTSDDIGHTEDDGTSPDASVQLAGTGDIAADFSWTGPAPGSRGAPNDGQHLTAEAAETDSSPGFLTDAEEPGDVVDTLVRPSDPANELFIEGESLVPTATGTVVASQASSGNLVWSDDRQLRVNAAEPFDTATVTFQVPRTGSYRMSADMTAGPNFGVAEISLDGEAIAQFDGRPTVNRNVLRRRHPLGEHDLAAGAHTLTLTAIQANVNGQVRIGLDVLRLRLQPADGRLVLTPWRSDSVAGNAPLFGWSSDPADQLTLENDGEGISDWQAIADTATLVFEAVGIDAGPTGDDFLDGITVRGHKIPIDYDVSNGTQFVTHGIQISGELLKPGANTITFFSGPDPDVGANLDDFTLRNVWLVMADGTIIKDPSKPDGTPYLLGDNAAGAVRERFWTYPIPPSSDAGPRYAPARAYTLDTLPLTDGDHVVSLSAEGSADTARLQHRYTVDNNAPVVSDLSPADGAAVKGSFLLDATVTDLGPSAPVVVATLDGSPVELGTTLNTDDMADGQHTFSVVATDAAGASDEATTTFTTIGETPDAPQLVAPADGASGVATTAQLKVTATDPSAEPLRVSFLRATPAGPPVLGRAGTADGEVPAPATDAGELVDLQSVAAADDVYVESAPTSDSPFQRYDVRVTKVRGAKHVDLSWEGRVAADREVVLSVWNVEAQQWTEVAHGRGSDETDTSLVGRTRLGPVIDGDVVHVLVEARDSFDEIPSTADEEFADPADYDFALAWITDTQYLSQGGVRQTPEFGPTFTAMTEWVRANAGDRKIVYSAHTGDVINNWQVTSLDPLLASKEFQFASDQMAILDNGLMPNGVTPGNHDNKTGSDNDLFNQYFGPSRYDAAEDVAPTGEDGEGYYGAPWQPGDNQNHYDLVEAAGQKLLFLYLGYNVKPDEIAWANEVLAQYRDRKAVVLTHSYLQPSMAADGRGGELTIDDGEDIFEQVVVPNPNVFMTLSGHTHGVGLNIRRDVGVKGRMVVEMLANHQFFELPGGERRVGHLRLLQVNLAKGQVAVDTYSPYQDDFNANEFDTRPGRDYLPIADEFVIPVDLQGRTTGLRTDTVGVAVRTDTVIGTADIASGGTAEVTWNGLAAGTRYGWYARATDAGGFSAESTAFTFTTAGTTATKPQP